MANKATRQSSDSWESKDQQAIAGQLALEIMHEIRNPLETLGHVTYLASLEADNPDQVRSYMRMAEEQLRNLGLIAGQTLSFAKLSREHEPIDLVTLTESALRISSAIDRSETHSPRPEAAEGSGCEHSGLTHSAGAVQLNCQCPGRNA